MWNQKFYQDAKTQNPDIWSAALAQAAEVTDRDSSDIDDIAENVSIAFSRLTISADIPDKQVNMWGEEVARETLTYNLEKYIFDDLHKHLRKVRPCKSCASYQSHLCSDCSGFFWV